MMMMMMMIQLCVVTALFHATAAANDSCMRYGLDIDQPGASCTNIYVPEFWKITLMGA